MTALSVGLGWVVFALLAILTRGLLVAASKNAPSPPRTQAATGAQVSCVRGHYYQLNPARNTWICATCHHHVPREVAS